MHVNQHVSKTIINPDISDYVHQPMFLGEKGIQRFDEYKYKFLYNKYIEQKASNWNPEEVSLLKDKADFKSLPEDLKFIFTANLSYQTLLDTDQVRGMTLLLDYVSLNELESAMVEWLRFENLHSYSYTYIVRNVIPNPKKFFDNIFKDKYIKERAEATTKFYNDLLNADVSNIEELKDKIYLLLVAINILEGVRFYVSFACSYAFAEQTPALMEGNAKVIFLINKDENIHLQISQFILKQLRNNEEEGFTEVAKRNEEKVYQMFEQAAKEEMEWADYIFQSGSLLGLNATILKEYMKWLTNRRMRALELKPLFGNISSANPLSWIDKWTDSKKINVAPQETELETYKIGSYKRDTDESFFEQLNL